MSNTGVIGHAQVVEDQPGVFVELVHFLSNVFDTFGFDEAQSKAAYAGDVLGAAPGANPASVLAIIPIENVVAAVFDGRMAAVNFEQMSGIDLVGRTAGDAVGAIAGGLASLFIARDSFNGKSLGDMGKVKIIVKRGGNLN